ncbi:MAG: arylsulfatase [Nocardioidaceae bacterium]|nr:arylsulfatase [Nocardioidaceae bacterium]
MFSDPRTHVPRPRPVTRRSLLGALGTSAVLGLTAGRGATPTAHAASTGAARNAPRPNILLVVVDDLGWGEVGAYGQKVLATPSLDRIADEGLRFTQAYATPTCAPTRCSLFTGKHTGHARVKQNSDAAAGLLPQDVTVAEILKGVGYDTGIVGKWGLGPDTGDNPSHPNRQGFDYFFGYINQRHAHDYWPTYLWRNSTRLSYPENDGADVTYAGTLITEEALGYLDRVDAATPFFLDVSYTTPHAPNEIPDEGRYADETWPEGERNHAEQVTWTDTQVGLLLDRLEQRDLAANTLVLVVSDNGPHQEGASYGHVGSRLPHDPEFFDSNGPLRGIKRDVYEGGIRVPMVARIPESLRTEASPAAGSVVSTPLAVWDLLPTFADLAGATTPEGLDGISFAPTILGDPQPTHDHLYWQFPEGGFDEAVRWGQWKAVHDRGPVELYRLNRDLSETTDVASDHPALVHRAERLMADSVA